MIVMLCQQLQVMKGMKNFQSMPIKKIKKELPPHYEFGVQLLSINSSDNQSHSQNITFRQTPPLIENKDCPKQQQTKWMKCFNFGKCLNSVDKKAKHHKKQKSADLVFLNRKPQALFKSEHCPSVMSHLHKKSKNFKNKSENLMKKQKKKKSVEIYSERIKPSKSTKKNTFMKKKSKPPTYDLFRSSKLASIKSVDMSLVGSTKEQEFDYDFNFTENITSQVEPQYYPFFSEEIKEYQRLKEKEEQSRDETEEQWQLYHTQHLIKKYINKQSQPQSPLISQISPIQKKKSSKPPTSNEFLLGKIQDMLDQIKKKKQSTQQSEIHQKHLNSEESQNSLKKVDVIEFDKMLSNRMRNLNERREGDLMKLEDQFEEGIIQEQEFLEERKKIQKWMSYQIQNTSKVKSLLKNGVHSALKILTKAENEIDWSNTFKKKPISNSKSLSSLKRASPSKSSSSELRPENRIPSPIFLPEISDSQKDEIKKIYQPEQVEEVFENIFMQLCFEMSEEPIDYSRIISLIQNKSTYDSNRKGFDCGRKYVSTFIREFLTFIQGSKEMMKEMKKILMKPIGPTPYEMLKYMREDLNEIEDVESIEKNTEDSSYVLNFLWFEQFSKQYVENYEFDKFFKDTEKQQKRIHFLKIALHFSNKSIFDGLNEAFDKHRPYGLFGIPFPWKQKHNIVHQYTQPFVENILRKVVQQVTDNSMFLCGVILDKEKSQFSQYSLTKTQVYDLQEDRMIKFLCHDVNENEPRLLFTDDEETEIMMEISNYVFLGVVKEMIGELVKILLI